MMTKPMNEEFRQLFKTRQPIEGTHPAKRGALRDMLERRRQTLVDYREGQHYGEVNARQTFARLSAETTLILIAMRSCE